MKAGGLSILSLRKAQVCSRIFLSMYPNFCVTNIEQSQKIQIHFRLQTSSKFFLVMNSLSEALQAAQDDQARGRRHLG
jgi:hypothetical protein